MDYLVNLNLNRNELQNVKIQNLATAPSSPTDGQIYYNTADDIMYYYNGTKWVPIVDDGGVTSVTGGTDISVSGSTGAITINHDDIETTSAVSTAGIKKITTDGHGHIKTTGTAYASDLTMSSSDSRQVSTAISEITQSLSSYVPTSTTVNGKALSSNITLDAEDIPIDLSDISIDTADNVDEAIRLGIERMGSLQEDLQTISNQKADKATTLAGYGITDAKIQNGTITLGSNTITPLTSFTETDPVFSASAAAGITSTDITNWNAAKPGTVTSVRVQATSPVQSSTSTAQSSTLNTTISLADGYGDTKNPYGTKTANYVLAGPISGSAAAPTFRALTSDDIPDLSSAYLPLSGGTLTGALTLNGDPTSNLHAATKKYVDDAIDALPDPMVFKGSLGTGGTISTLPTASSSTKGWTYKVITDGTYSCPGKDQTISQDAKVGDLFISDGSNWVYIPSADEPSGTVTSVGISNSGLITISGSPITSSGSITIGHGTPSGATTISTAGFYKIKTDSYGHVNGTTAVVKSDITGLLGDYVTSVNGSTGAVTISNATQSSAGLMSAADKTTLDSLSAASTGAITHTSLTITAGTTSISASGVSSKLITYQAYMGGEAVMVDYDGSAFSINTAQQSDITIKCVITV